MVKVLSAILIFISLSFSMDVVKAMFPTYTLKERDFKKAVENVKASMEAQGLKVLRVLTLSEALKARGVDFPDYYIIFGCQSENMDKILAKAPAMSNLLPCSVAVYRDKDGRVKASSLNEKPFLAKYGKLLTVEERREIASTYRTLNKTLNTLSVRPVRVMKVPPPKKDFVYEVPLKGVDYDEYKMLFESSLNGVNMNVLGVMNVSSNPKFDIFLACNLSYGEKILSVFPQFGTLAPCRVYTYESEGSVKVGYINIPLLMEIYRRHLSAEAVDIFKKADEDIKNAIKEASGI